MSRESVVLARIEINLSISVAVCPIDEKPTKTQRIEKIKGFVMFAANVEALAFVAVIAFLRAGTNAD